MSVFLLIKINFHFYFQITTIIHEPNSIVYLEFYLSVDGTPVNASVVVATFKVPHVNLLNAALGVQVVKNVGIWYSDNYFFWRGVGREGAD